MNEPDQSCHIDFQLQPDGTFGVNLWGHPVPWARGRIVGLRNLLAMALGNVPEDIAVLALQIVVNTQIIIHLTPADVQALIEKADNDLRYLGAKDMREAREGFEVD